MPKVGGEKFAYDKQGMEEAQEYAQETGQDVIPSYDAGGRVERIQGYGKGGEVKSPPSESSSNPKFAGSRKGGTSPYQHEDYGEVAYEKGGKVKAKGKPKKKKLTSAEKEKKLQDSYKESVYKTARKKSGETAYDRGRYSGKKTPFLHTYPKGKDISNLDIRNVVKAVKEVKTRVSRGAPKSPTTYQHPSEKEITRKVSERYGKEASEYVPYKKYSKRKKEGSNSKKNK